MTKLRFRSELRLPILREALDEPLDIRKIIKEMRGDAQAFAAGRDADVALREVIDDRFARAAVCRPDTYDLRFFARRA